jgi:N6-adenosine-specific RNA methylase IME4
MKRYSIIYADPPWHYRTYTNNVGGLANDHYPTMSIDEICALPVASLADKNAILFLWVTFPKLNEVFEVIEAWGFTYKTVAFVWVKQNRKADSLFLGMGYWTRSNAEICLLATKGSISRISTCVRQIVISHLEKHSKKPDVVREKIVELVGDLPRVELFAREKADGWDSWGNEVDSNIDLVSYDA